MSVSKAVLITGCSSGIGWSTAKRLSDVGWRVYATARNVEKIAPLEASGCRLLPLDVTDEDSMGSAVEEVEREEGAVGALVNNAGYSQSGAVETVPMEKVRAQFETNVFGLVRLTQLVLPAMRRARSGKIVNLSSMGGKLVFPGGGFYHATKYAVEAISDALRFEVKGFGVDVVIIEPGIIKTQFGDTAVGAIEEGTAPDGDYGDFNAAVAKATADVYDGPMSRLGGGPETVASKIEKALTANRPRARYTVTPSAKLLLTQRALLPDRGWDAFVATRFPRPGK